MRGKGVDSNAAAAVAFVGPSGSTSIPLSAIVSSGAHVSDVRNSALTVKCFCASAAHVGQQAGGQAKAKLIEAHQCGDLDYGVYQGSYQGKDRSV